MSRRFHQLLFTGCLLIGILQAPAALSSLEAGWDGAYPSEPSGTLSLAGTLSAREKQADAKSDSAEKKLEGLEETAPSISRAGF